MSYSLLIRYSFILHTIRQKKIRQRGSKPVGLVNYDEIEDSPLNTIRSVISAKQSCSLFVCPFPFSINNEDKRDKFKL